MRLDKYLKVSRLIKRRTLAKEVADSGRITINTKIAKSSTKVEENDVISITFGSKIVTVRIIKLVDSTKKEDAANMYEIIEEKSI